MTRTFVYYFADEQLATLREDYEMLRRDFVSRIPHMATDTAMAGMARLDMLGAILIVLAEKVKEA